MTLVEWLTANSAKVSWQQSTPTGDPLAPSPIRINQPIDASLCVFVYPSEEIRLDLYRIDDYCVSSRVSAGGYLMVKRINRIFVERSQYIGAGNGKND